MKGRKAKSKAKPKPKAPEPKAETEEGKDGKAAAATPDPIAGTWTGRIQGDPPVPPEGLALVLTLVRAEDGSMSGSLEVSGQGETALDTLSFDAAEGKVRFTATTPVGALTGEGTVEGNRQTGTWSIPGFADGTYEVERQEATDAKPTTTPKGEGKERKEGAKEKKKEPKPVEIDFEGLEDRIHRIGIANSSERGLLWSPDGKKLAFQATVNGARGIYTVTFPDDLKPQAADDDHRRRVGDG